MPLLLRLYMIYSQFYIHKPAHLCIYKPFICIADTSRYVQAYHLFVCVGIISRASLALYTADCTVKYTMADLEGVELINSALFIKVPKKCICNYRLCHFRKEHTAICQLQQLCSSENSLGGMTKAHTVLKSRRKQAVSRLICRKEALFSVHKLCVPFL